MNAQPSPQQQGMPAAGADASPNAQRAEFDDVQKAERIEIGQRRRAAGLEVDDGPNGLVGLALSGGGVRSASFNLGLVQALSRRRLLKRFDYLSTVSGGGYIGTFLTSLFHTAAQPEKASAGQPAGTPPTPPSPAGGTTAYPQPLLDEVLGTDEGRQTDQIKNFVRNGKYLNDPRPFFSHYFIGLFLNNLAIGSALLWLCLAFAWLWRCLDSNYVAGHLYGWAEYIGSLPRHGWAGVIRPFGVIFTEGSRPLLPALAAGLVWLLLWVFGYLRSSTRPPVSLASWVFTSAASFFFVGMAVVLATPYIEVPTFSKDVTVTKQAIVGPQQHVFVAVASFVLAGLLPFLKPRRLIQSGLHPSSVWESRLFLVACSALFVGVPLLLVWWFAHHNISGTDHEQRETKLMWADIKDKTNFFKRLQAESNNVDSPGYFICKRLRDDDALMELFVGNVPPDKVRFDLKRINKMGLQAVPLEEEDRKLYDAVLKRLNEDVIPKREFTNVVCKFWRDVVPGVAGRAARPSGTGHDLTAHPAWPRITTLLSRYLEGRMPNPDQESLMQDSEQEGRPAPSEISRLNRLLLEAAYPEDIRPQTVIARPNIIEADQEWREKWLLILLAVFLTSSFVNLNATSLHSYYRDHLAWVFLYRPYRKARHGLDPDDGLAGVRSTASGGPYPLINTTLNWRPGDPFPSETAAAEAKPPAEAGANLSVTEPNPIEHPGQTATETFLLSPAYCGSASFGYCKTLDYMGGRLGLDDAMAISGGAFSPLLTSNPLIGFLMTIFNLRLGQWLAHPDPRWRFPKRRVPEQRGRGRWLRQFFFRPTILRWLRRCFIRLAILRIALDPERPGRGRWLRQFFFGPTILRFALERLLFAPLRLGLPSGARRYNFITDGGHHDNLGLAPLLRRRCQLIVVSDATQDEGYHFEEFLRVLRRARFEDGIRIHVPRPGEAPGAAIDDAGIVSLLDLLRPPARPPKEGKSEEADKSALKSAPHSRLHFVQATIAYPKDGDRPADRGRLFYLKTTLTGDEPADLQFYAANNPMFPHDPTPDQFYAEDRFESYRQLGEHIGQDLCEELKKMFDQSP